MNTMTMDLRVIFVVSVARDSMLMKINERPFWTGRRLAAAVTPSVHKRIESNLDKRNCVSMCSLVMWLMRCWSPVLCHWLDLAV